MGSNIFIIFSHKKKKRGLGYLCTGYLSWTGKKTKERQQKDVQLFVMSYSAHKVRYRFQLSVVKMCKLWLVRFSRKHRVSSPSQGWDLLWCWGELAPGDTHKDYVMTGGEPHLSVAQNNKTNTKQHSGTGQAKIIFIWFTCAEMWSQFLSSYETNESCECMFRSK